MEERGRVEGVGVRGEMGWACCLQGGKLDWKRGVQKEAGGQEGGRIQGLGINSRWSRGEGGEEGWMWEKTWGGSLEVGGSKG